MKYKNIISGIIALLSSQLWCTEKANFVSDNNSKEQTLLTQSYNSYGSENIQMFYESEVTSKEVKKRDSYTCCPRPYDDRTCFEYRIRASSLLAPGITLLLAKTTFMPWIISCCGALDESGGGTSCVEAYKYSWCGDQSNQTNSAMCAMTNIVIVASSFYAACVWAPWFDKSGCNLCKKNHAQEDDIELQKDNYLLN